MEVIFKFQQNRPSTSRDIARWRQHLILEFSKTPIFGFYQLYLLFYFRQLIHTFHTCIPVKGQNACTSWEKSAKRFRSYGCSKLAPKMKMTVWATPRPVYHKNCQILCRLQESLSQMINLLTPTDGQLQSRGIWKKMTRFAQKMVKKWAQNHDFWHMAANISWKIGMIGPKLNMILKDINLRVYIKYWAASLAFKVSNWAPLSGWKKRLIC